MTSTDKAGRDTRPAFTHNDPDDIETDPFPARTAWRWFLTAAVVVTVGMGLLMLERAL